MAVQKQQRPSFRSVLEIFNKLGVNKDKIAASMIKAGQANDVTPDLKDTV